MSLRKGCKNMNQQLDTLTEAQLCDAVCLAHRACKVCDGGARITYCAHCEGKGPKPGRVWALPGTQEKCHLLLPSGLHLDNCTGGCHGSGWVAKRDLGALLDCPYWRYIDINQDDENAYTCRIVVDEEQYFGKAAKRSLALLRAVAQALVAQGAELGGRYV